MAERGDARLKIPWKKHRCRKRCALTLRLRSERRLRRRDFWGLEKLFGVKSNRILILDHADAQARKVRIEDVLAVSGRRHHGCVGVRFVAVQSDVLTGEMSGERYAEVDHALKTRQAARARVPEVSLRRHLAAVTASRL